VQFVLDFGLFVDAAKQGAEITRLHGAKKK
jgi:hypothetical protein